MSIFLKTKFGEIEKLRLNGPKAKAFSYLDMIFSGDFNPEAPYERTDALLRGAQFATKKVDWEMISSHLRSDYRTFGPTKRDSFERFFFANCHIAVMREVSDDLVQKAIEMFWEGELPGAAIRMIHLAFSSLLAVYDRNRKEVDRDTISQFITVIEQIAREKQGNRAYPLPADLAGAGVRIGRFTAFRYGLSDPIPDPNWDERRFK